ncbi:hypothetical protein N0V90_004759 [Kalmusia sp. IMI 367209]|nr:hypothetical protein N0V90_004759 [Kalmusia sp. IMI 367209]
MYCWMLSSRFTVEGIGKIQLPLSRAGVQTLVNAIHLTSLGEGDENNAWELAAKHVSFADGDLWRATLNDIVDKVHERPARSKDHSATLLIFLPTAHNGGSTHISLAGQTRKFDTHSHSATRFQFLAWFNETVWKVNPITTGVRLVLVYKLSITNDIGDKISYGVPSYATAAKLDSMLQMWNADNKKCVMPHMLAYKLEHLYGPNDIYDDLRGCDAARVYALRSSCEKAGYKILLGVLKKTIACLVRIKHTDARGHEMMGTFPDIDDSRIKEYHHTIAQVQDPTGRVVLARSIIHAHEIAQSNPFASKPDDGEFSPADGYSDDYSTEETDDMSALWEVEHQYNASIVLLIPPCNFPVWKVRSWFISPYTSNAEAIKEYLDLQLLAAQGWTGISQPDPDLSQICEQLLAHDKASKLNNPTNISCAPSVPFKALEKIAIIALEYDQSHLFRQACVQILQSTHRVVLCRRAHNLMRLLAQNLLQTANFDKVDFWVSLHRNAMQKIDASDAIMTAFGEAKKNKGLFGSLPDIRPWQAKWFREICAQFEPTADLGAEELARLLHIRESIEDTAPGFGTRSLLRQQSENLRRSFFVCDVILQLLKRTDSHDSSLLDRHVRTLAFAVVEAGGSESCDPYKFYKFVDLGTKVKPHTLALLIPILTPLVDDIPCILTFLYQAAQLPVWNSPEFSSIFQRKILEPAIARISYSKIHNQSASGGGTAFTDDTIRTCVRNAVQNTGISIAELKLFIERLRACALAPCFPALFCRLNELNELDLVQLRTEFSTAEWDELQKLSAKDLQDETSQNET